MAALNYEELNARLCTMDVRAALIDYIWKSQGEASGRLDFKAAGEAIGCSARTVGRMVTELADNKLLLLHAGADGGELQINPAILK